MAKEPREFLPTPWNLYFERRVAELSSPDWLAQITSNNWPTLQAKMRTQLQQMLGLDPWPQRTPLHPVITGTVPGDGYLVEKLHFQSLPGLYVTANLYRPKEISKPLPAILYLCGHASAITNKISFGNKTAYQHHGIWFARHGYVCLIIDTIQLGEILGHHHGTYKLNRWWWPARGYTPAGVEAWNSIRALDYLQTRPEVDSSRIGVTGRSGGGAYSWWVAALDQRVKVAAPTAGIATLKNHILDGCIEGHCDCMFMVNTERWDFDRVAALIAPRPLLIINTDRDHIFPLDGVVEIYNRIRSLYRKLGHETNIGLHIAEGGHRDLPTVHIGAFLWMNRFLKNTDPMEPMDEPAQKRHAPRELRVFSELPKDERVTTADEWFVPQQPTNSPDILRQNCFRAWPAHPDAKANPKTCEFTSEPPFTFKLHITRGRGRPERLLLHVLDDEDPQPPASSTLPKPAPNEIIAYFHPRGTGPTSWSKLTPTKQTHLRRRLLLLGETLESGQVWDIQQAVAALRSLPALRRLPLTIRARGHMAANALYAALLLPEKPQLELENLPASHRDGPIYLNILRHMDIPQARSIYETSPTTTATSSQLEKPCGHTRHTVEKLAK
ncbi:MAG: alpha/beta hydrolase family protein [Verrucomicrobiae bacterium]|nr:alpha/beta hydrolase family protein [Verrucomicrobiae bacterium]